ncbi:MAG: hypothetical protein QM752_04070 [Gammaproteobacteria bacterium]
MLGQIQLRQEIAIRLKQAREQAGFSSPEAFCQQYHLNVKEYTKHEAGAAALRASHALRYTQLLKVSIQWLMIGEEKQAS